jgi:DNA-binding CsgD family transcriptional regulator
LNAIARAEILDRYNRHVERFERDAASRRRHGLAVVVDEPAEQGAPTAASLSAREQNVLELVARGLTDNEIAQETGISEFTVKTHLRHLYVKLEARNRAHAVALGVQQGLLKLCPCC